MKPRSRIDARKRGCAAWGSNAAAAPVAVALEVVSDAICPWCYVGKRRLEAAIALLPAGVTVDITWLPFELNPDMPKGGVERDDYRRRKFGSLERSRALDKQVAAVAAGEGITMRHDLMQRTPNTVDTHRLIWLAKQQGVQDSLVEALFRGYFVEGRDIGDHDGPDRSRRRCRDRRRSGTPDAGERRRRGRGRSTGPSGGSPRRVGGADLRHREQSGVLGRPAGRIHRRAAAGRRRRPVIEHPPSLTGGDAGPGSWPPASAQPVWRTFGTRLLVCSRNSFGMPAAEQRAEIHVEGVGDAGAGRVDEVIRHGPRLGGDGGQRHEVVVDLVAADPLDGDRAVAVAPDRVLHRLLADLAGLALVDVGDAADEGALHVAEGVGADPLDLQPLLDEVGEPVGQRAGAGEVRRCRARPSRAPCRAGR